MVEDRTILDEMEAQGLPRHVPVIKRGEDWADAQVLDEVARIADVDHESDPLSVDELYHRLDVILDVVQRYIQLVPRDELETTLPDRPRSIGELTYHIFSIPESFLEHEDGVPLKSYKPEPEWSHRSSASLATYGEHVQVRLRDWYEDPGKRQEWTETADVYYGSPSVHLFFERTTWHSGQHARQLKWMLEEELDVSIEPIDPELWNGLPMPEKVWDAV